MCVSRFLAPESRIGWWITARVPDILCLQRSVMFLCRENRLTHGKEEYTVSPFTDGYKVNGLETFMWAHMCVLYELSHINYRLYKNKGSWPNPRREENPKDTKHKMWTKMEEQKKNNSIINQYWGVLRNMSEEWVTPVSEWINKYLARVIPIMLTTQCLGYSKLNTLTLITWGRGCRSEDNFFCVFRWGFFFQAKC